MTLIEAAEKALEALEHLHRTGDTQVFDLCYAPKVIPALRTAIEQAEKQDGWVLREVLFDEGEPIAHREPAQPAPVPWSQALESVWAEDDTTPPAARREWVDLTDEDIESCYGGEINDVARAVINKFKGKNT